MRKMLVLLLVPVLLPAAEPAFLPAVRRGDAVEMQSLLKAGADPNARDETGATALMYASAFASVECMRLLLDAGADVNAASKQGSTALMWATADAPKVRLLLDHHADVNARNAEGGTALLSAAFRDNVEVVRILAVAGADIHAQVLFGPVAGVKIGLGQIAYSTNETGLRDFMKASGIEPPGLEALTTRSLGAAPIGNLVRMQGFSLRRQAAASNAGALAAILDLGAPANEDLHELALTIPALSRVAALGGDPEAVQVMLDRGADPNRKGTGGITPLMAAAAADPPDPQSIRLLLDKGATINAQDEMGRTALDWALLQGETESSRLLREKGGRPLASYPVPPLPVDQPRTTREAVRLAIARLQPAGPGFFHKSGCISCHNQSLPAIAVQLAAARGVPVDQNLESHPTQATFAVWGPFREDFLIGNCRIPGFLGNVAYGFLALSEEGFRPNAITDAAASCLSAIQRPDGSWQGGDARPPLAGRSPILYTALAVHALNAYAVPGRQVETAERIARARDFLRAAVPNGTQAGSFKLLGLIWSGAAKPEIITQVSRLRKLQRADGGWAERSTMPPDAYATGQALYALHAGGLATSGSSYRRAIAYLLRTQLEDGTWYMRSRAIGFQPYFESGFPHGRDQFISAAATAWAAIALAAGL